MTERLRILIVEDHTLIAMDLAELLTGSGHDVCAIARTQAEAVAAAARFHPDLMIVDGQLDEGSGVGAMREILAQGFVAHIYVTGDEARLRGLTRDAVVLTKPFSLNSLLVAMAQVRPVGGAANVARPALRSAG
jgi:DNA-binding response OmpR family regulator